MSKAKNRAGIFRLQPEGEMTIYNAAALKVTLQDALHKNEEIEIDLSKVSEIDTAGLQLLLLVHREAASRQKPLRLVNYSAATLELFHLYQMAEHFGDPALVKPAQ